MDLISIAISLASGIAMDLFNRPESKVDTEIKKAFNLSLKDWTQNDEIRKRVRPELEKEIQTIIINPEKLQKDSQFYDFYILFNEVV